MERIFGRLLGWRLFLFPQHSLHSSNRVLGRICVDSWRVRYIDLGKALEAEAAWPSPRSRRTDERRSATTAAGLNAELALPRVGGRRALALRD